MIGIADASRLGTHAFRRRMARDIVDLGGSLATLLRAGEWRSDAFAACLKENQSEEKVLSRMVVDHWVCEHKYVLQPFQVQCSNIDNG